MKTDLGKSSVQERQSTHCNRSITQAQEKIVPQHRS